MKPLCGVASLLQDLKPEAFSAIMKIFTKALHTFGFFGTTIYEGPFKSRKRRRTMELQSKRTGKAPMGDGEIVELYFKRDERAIAETDKKYGKYLLSVAYNVLHDRLDCEDCLNDTYLGVWNAIPPSRPTVLKAFLLTVMRRTAIKRYHTRTKQSAIPSEITASMSELEDFVAGDGDVAKDFDSARLGLTISDFVRSLPERKRFIFMSRYYVSDRIDTIAAELGVSRSTVNKELAVIRNALKERLESEGYTV